MDAKEVKCPLTEPRDLISGNVEIVSTEPLRVRLLTWDELEERRAVRKPN